jgi:fused signal recognition particle receptor
MVFQFLKSGISALGSALKKTRNFFSSRLKSLFSRPIDEKLYEELEELFYEADLGVKFSGELAIEVRKFLQKNPDAKADDVLSFIEGQLLEHGGDFDYSLKCSSDPKEPTVILVCGTNGNGKTTFIAKLAHRLMQEGHKPLLAACDTFRAGAQEQLDIWAKRVGVDAIAARYQADPAACAFDAIAAAKARGKDFVLIDTAGRLDNKTHLMKELEKIKRSCQKQVPEAPHETLLVIDASVGQNSLSVARVFRDFVPLSGLVVTKIDGTAKGGAALAIQRELKIPIKFLSLGEKIGDLAPFEPKSFIHALFFDE